MMNSRGSMGHSPGINSDPKLIEIIEELNSESIRSFLQNECTSADFLSHPITQWVNSNTNIKVARDHLWKKLTNPQAESLPPIDEESYVQQFDAVIAVCIAKYRNYQLEPDLVTSCTKTNSKVACQLSRDLVHLTREGVRLPDEGDSKELQRLLVKLNSVHKDGVPQYEFERTQSHLLEITWARSVAVDLLLAFNYVDSPLLEEITSAILPTPSHLDTRRTQRIISKARKQYLLLTSN